MVDSHVILMRLTVMILESIANKMRVVAYTEVRVLDELGGILYPSDAVFSLHCMHSCLSMLKFRSNINVLHTLNFLSNISFYTYVDK